MRGPFQSGSPERGGCAAVALGDRHTIETNGGAHRVPQSTFLALAAEVKVRSSRTVLVLAAPKKQIDLQTRRGPVMGVRTTARSMFRWRNTTYNTFGLSFCSKITCLRLLRAFNSSKNVF
jgi:hypothetical protein